jgi:hypothetical protein
MRLDRASAELAFLDWATLAGGGRFGSGLRADFVMREILVPVMALRYGPEERRPEMPCLFAARTRCGIVRAKAVEAPGVRTAVVHFCPSGRNNQSRRRLQRLWEFPE